MQAFKSSTVPSVTARTARAACATRRPPAPLQCRRRPTLVVRGLKENVAALPPIDGVDSVVVAMPEGPWLIPNAPGKAASARIFAHLGAKGVVDAAAAEEGLRLYGEYVEEARTQPGSHPNIDILFRIQAEKLQCPVTINRAL